MEDPLENGLNPVPGSPERAKGVVGRLEAENLDRQGKEKKQIVTWSERDSMIETCVEFGLSLTQIRDFSLSWPQPMNHVSQVSERVKALSLRATFERRKRKRVGYHNEMVGRTFMRIAGQMMERGWTLERITREKKVFDESAVQPDWYFEAVQGKTRKFFAGEVQAAKTKFTLWRRKLMQYAKQYEAMDGELRVLVMVHSPDELSRARQGARDVLRQRGIKANIFLFALITEIDRKHSDVVTARIWKPTWSDMSEWSLVSS